jgi:hypothetical protein
MGFFLTLSFQSSANKSGYFQPHRKTYSAFTASGGNTRCSGVVRPGVSCRYLNTSFLTALFLIPRNAVDPRIGGSNLF